ncbi:MAG: tRNA uridine-5-carboxymethylaminomethyl(34) synthesis enzyme MnmG [Ignavibacteriae bacterium]|nr:tRNA uridine-5-carboxymethylaminomethyl(34) synthesis enzyme MnmG [Ignavibacteriota bacterium]
MTTSFHEEPSRSKYEVIVVGGGHAGIEAALAASRMGCSTAMITMDLESIGRMSCNPAIGGSAKGHLVREIDALGGEMAKIADATGIHFRMLNKSKGPAIWSPRCQNDRDCYSNEAKRRVLGQEGLDVIQDGIGDILLMGNRLEGAVTFSGRVLRCKSLVICSGTFLNAVMHTGTSKCSGGRFGEPAANGLSERLAGLGFKTGRLKTGTPPRVDINSIDFSVTEEQPPDDDPTPFSFQTLRISNKQISMYLTHTNSETHEILRKGFDESPMFAGRIKGVGPRYCPSIEDKLNRFAERDRHQIFLEPEGYNTNVVYVNGFSTSLPARIQQEALQSIQGLEHSVMIRPGYAVEYDYFPPHQLNHTLESKIIKGLFFAGQVNGTSGYEEAAGQGLVAGINAALAVKGEEPLILQRCDAYIGVMIDDLINKGTDEPYRIFTSRAEHRLLLRQDNADSRLMRKGASLGLIPREVIRRVEEKEKRVTEAIQVLKSMSVLPAQINDLLSRRGSQGLSESENLVKILRRPEINLAELITIESLGEDQRLKVLTTDKEAMERVEIEVKYEGYLRRQEEQAALFQRHEGISIPEDFDFSKVKSLSAEGKEKMRLVKPTSVGQASRISGVTPADISVLMVNLKNYRSTWNELPISKAALE